MPENENVDDEDLKEWSERIWAANEYRYGDLSTIKAFVEWVLKEHEQGNR